MTKIALLLLITSISFAQDKQAIIQAFDNAAREFNVPSDVLKGVSFAETRWEQLTWTDGDTASACTGMPRPYGIMSLWDNEYFGHSLTVAATLIGRDPVELKSDMVQNIRGAAALLKKYYSELPLPEGTNTDEIESWRNAIAAYSGLPQIELAQQHALDIYSKMAVGYHKYHIDWNARPVDLRFVRAAVTKIQSEARASKQIRGNAIQGTMAQPDYPLAKWVSAYPGHWYENGWNAQYGKNFVVIHDMEGYYLGTISYFQMSSTSASAHYCVNSGYQPDGRPGGEITQMVEERNAAWHVRCWNTYMFGIEHEGFVNNAAWYTDDMYQSSAALTSYLCNKYNIPMDRNHVVGHQEWQNGTWTSWMAANYPSIDVTCNSHTDPGANWNWNYYMILVRGDTLPPKVAEIIPKASALGVKAYSPIAVKFTSFMDTAAADQAFSITPPVSGSISWSADFKTMTFKPVSLLSFGTSYSVKIDSTAKNKALGLALDGNGDGIGGDPFQFSFTTEPPDTVPPVVVTTYPENNNLGVPVLAEPIITLNKPLQASSLVSRIALLDGNNANVPITSVGLDSLNDHGIITFVSSGLRPNSSYTINVLAGLKDLYGNATTSGLAIEFTTSPDVVTEGIVFDKFESNTRAWIQPNQNTSSSQFDSTATLFTFSSEKLLSGSQAGKLAYKFTQSQNGVVVLQAGGSPTFDNYSSFGIWVYGDNSHNEFDLVFQPQNQMFLLDTIDWRGWKYMNIPLGSVNGPGRQFSSLIVRQRPSGATSGVLYFDNMQVNAVVSGAPARPIGFPTRFGLAQNFPNPFNPSTIIRYQIPKESHVRLTVYDLLGQTVRVLVDENKGPGFHSSTFDASGLSSGIYFYGLESIGFHDVQKMLLVR